jgi:hypothetical protein
VVWRWPLLPGLGNGLLAGRLTGRSAILKARHSYVCCFNWPFEICTYSKSNFENNKRKRNLGKIFVLFEKHLLPGLRDGLISAARQSLKTRHSHICYFRRPIKLKKLLQVESVFMRDLFPFQIWGLACCCGVFLTGHLAITIARPSHICHFNQPNELKNTRRKYSLFQKHSFPGS